MKKALKNFFKSKKLPEKKEEPQEELQKEPQEEPKKEPQKTNNVEQVTKEISIDKKPSETFLDNLLKTLHLHKSLYFIGNKLNNDQCVLLEGALKQNNSIEKLGFLDCEVGQEFAQLIAIANAKNITMDVVNTRDFSGKKYPYPSICLHNQEYIPEPLQTEFENPAANKTLVTEVKEQDKPPKPLLTEDEKLVKNKLRWIISTATLSIECDISKKRSCGKNLRKLIQNELKSEPQISADIIKYNSKAVRLAAKDMYKKLQKTSDISDSDIYLKPIASAWVKDRKKTWVEEVSEQKAEKSLHW